jgi:uncharacterized membrane protein YkoI
MFSSKLLWIGLLSALLAMGPAEADNRRGSGRQPPPPYSLDRAVEGVRSRTGGRVLSADTVRRDGRPIYDIKILTNDGRVRSMAIDGETGEPLQRRSRPRQRGNGDAYPRR